MALLAGEGAARETERRAARAAERIPVALLALRDGTISAERGEDRADPGVVLWCGLQLARPVGRRHAARADPLQRAVLRRDRRRRAEATGVTREPAVRDAVDDPRRLEGILRGVDAVADPARARGEQAGREDEVSGHPRERRERLGCDQDVRPCRPLRQVVREREHALARGRAGRVVEHEVGGAPDPAAVRERLLAGGEQAELDELERRVPLKAREHLVKRDQVVVGRRRAGDNERDEESDG